MLAELVTNAVEHGLEDCDGTVTVTAERDGDDLTVHVIDDGVGFADIGVEGRLATSGRFEVCDCLEADDRFEALVLFEAGVFFKANRQVEGGPEAGFEGDHSNPGR